jgi:hypothetical protein
MVQNKGEINKTNRKGWRDEMKRWYIMILLCLMSLWMCSCEKQKSETTEVCGYVSVEGDILKVDTVEWITDEDEERIKELGLTEEDLPDGYYILNESSDITSYKLNNETQYNFIDWNFDFVSKGDDQNISTTNKEDFIKYLNTYSDKGANQPFFIIIEKDVVKSITEKPMA